MLKKLRNNLRIKSSGIFTAIIYIPIFLSMCYFISYTNAEKANVSGRFIEKPSVTDTLPDSVLAKIQTAIDLANATPNETNYINLSLLYYQCGKYKECIDAAKKAIVYNAESYLAYNNICSASNQLGLWNEAIAAGKKALELKPGNQLATNNLKCATDGKAKQDEYLQDARALLLTHPSENNYMNLGYLYYTAREYELAINTYQQALAYNKNNSIAYNNICSAYNELGKWKEASENCEKALKIDSTFTLAKNNLKFALKKLKE